MIKRVTVDSKQELTPEEIAEIEEAKKHPIVFDEDCEELSPAMMEAFRQAVAQRNRRQRKAL